MLSPGRRQIMVLRIQVPGTNNIFTSIVRLQILFLLLTIFVSCTTGDPILVVRGQVQDASDSTPISSAFVTELDRFEQSPIESDSTDSRGRFEIVHNYHTPGFLLVMHPGYSDTLIDVLVAGAYKEDDSEYIYTVSVQLAKLK
jgi:hypothetical protein